jgi:nicotinamidase-related amidase
MTNVVNRKWVPAAVLSVIGVACATFAGSQTIVDDWTGVKPPPPPELKNVKVAPKETALLMLDFVKPICGARPRCMASLPRMQGLLGQARQSGVHVIHSVAGQQVSEIVPEVAPRSGEPSVSSGPNKFLNTELDKLLKERGVKTVIVVGTASEGAVLNTGAHAALTGYRVIVPVDGSSSLTTYAEQYTAWHLANAPRIGPQVTLTRSDLVGF